MSQKGTLLKDLGGKDRYLIYDLNAWSEIGDRLDIKVRLSNFQDDLLETRLPPRALRVLIWGGLIHDDPGRFTGEYELTETEVGSWVDEDNIGEILTAFFARFAGTSPGTAEAVAGALGVKVPELRETGK